MKVISLYLDNTYRSSECHRSHLEQLPFTTNNRQCIVILKEAKYKF